MTVLAVAVALYSLRFLGVLADRWFDIDQSIRGVIVQSPWPALTHMLVAPIALLIGPLQFFPQLRGRHPRLHRVTGRIYVAACLISGIASLVVAPHASGGPIAGFGFGLLAVCWIAATLGAWIAATRREFGWHRLLMRFSYAMTFGAVTLRLQIPLGLALGYHSYPAMSVWLAYTAWIPNVIVVAIYSMLTSRGAIRGVNA